MKTRTRRTGSWNATRTETETLIWSESGKETWKTLEMTALKTPHLRRRRRRRAAESGRLGSPRERARWQSLGLTPFLWTLGLV